ncbi:glycogen debranching protein GlgX [Novosphingobium sp.]|uniref:glycogen debranching protein GlgX n=1 Tax=Novosphingobium sp. TaxID=1874826 RepID=UPI00286EA772|nr:glycogen debranching protein GlgX [Novosphingobium sp.]
MSPRYGAIIGRGRTRFAVRSPQASALWLCLFDGDTERRIAMCHEGDDWLAELAEELPGAHYGYRAEGEWAPDRGLWFDPAKLLVDPYAVELDRRFVQHPSLAAFGEDTAAIVPRAIVQDRLPTVRRRKPRFKRGDLIYEVNVRGFSMQHPDVPEALRGTVAALAHPAVIAHLKKIGVGAVELMPIVAWIDERHLPPLGLTNAWGYNPVALMALDLGVCPGGVAELREMVSALHKAGIGVILDLVFNHTGESDIQGGVLSQRGLDNSAYAHAPDGTLINDTGCGNTLDFAQPPVRALVLDSLRHFVRHCGVDGFRFDLATIMARGPSFSEQAPIFAEIAADPLLADRVLIAEPWDIGPGGYQLGRFPQNWLEWNDCFRDDVRRFWRGDGGIGALATRIAGSSDIFGKDCRSVNFLAAHDGFTLADTVAYTERHNNANGEHNRDGHGDNRSWNCGTEGPSSDPAITARRHADQRALLATLFASTGTIMLTAGDEFGRSQAGNNNAYCQDNAIGWIDWQNRDRQLEDFVASLARTRTDRGGALMEFPEPGVWCRGDGIEMATADWMDSLTESITYVPDPSVASFALNVSRANRCVAWSELQDPFGSVSGRV